MELFIVAIVLFILFALVKGGKKKDEKKGNDIINEIYQKQLDEIDSQIENIDQQLSELEESKKSVPIYKKGCYVAIDFETATPKRSSACQLGIVVIENNTIVEEKSYLIQPPKNLYNRINTSIHGISATDTNNEKNFGELWVEIEQYMNNHVLLAHNASFDIDVLRKTSRLYDIDLFIPNYLCTYQMTGLPLIEAAQALGIQVTGHHDALEDAKMCAQIYLKLTSGVILNESLIKVRKGGKKEEDENTVSCFTDMNCSFFENKAVLITGVFGSFTRAEIKQVLENKGAIIKSDVSSKVDYVIAGIDAGPSKMEKIEALQEKGHHIQVINEESLLEIFK